MVEDATKNLCLLVCEAVENIEDGLNIVEGKLTEVHQEFLKLSYAGEYDVNESSNFREKRSTYRTKVRELINKNNTRNGFPSDKLGYREEQILWAEELIDGLQEKGIALKPLANGPSDSEDYPTILATALREQGKALSIGHKYKMEAFDEVEGTPKKKAKEKA